MKLIILTDYKNTFYSSTKNNRTLCTMNVEQIAKYFKQQGIYVQVLSFSKINAELDYHNTYIVYTSSEDYGLSYKSYIEDIVLFLNRKGATLIPDYPYLRAHHNKAFMELIRYQLLPEQAKLFNSKIYGTFEDIQDANLPNQKYVIKSAFGAGSKYVKSADSNEKLLKEAQRISKNKSLFGLLGEYKKRVLWRGYQRNSLNREKFIVQDFIGGLNGDFKVLKYGEKFYPLFRKNRENDFRASGGGRLSFDIPNDVDKYKLLDFAKEVSDIIGTPLCSMDIAWDGSKFLLVEFQCLCFGPYSAECSERYYRKSNETWEIIKEVCDLEKIFCEAIVRYIEIKEAEKKAID